jgi:hypothetical protein
MLKCVSKTPGDLSAADLAALAGAEASYQASMAALSGLQKRTGSVATFVGVTTLLTTGHITHAGADPGLSAAAAMCNDQYPGAHMCSAYDIYDTVVAGHLHEADIIAKSWAFFPAWKTPDPTAQDPLWGLADNCASYTYDGTDKGWSGVAVAWSTLSTGNAGIIFNSGVNAPCNQALPVACCR